MFIFTKLFELKSTICTFLGLSDNEFCLLESYIICGGAFVFTKLLILYLNII